MKTFAEWVHEQHPETYQEWGWLDRAVAGVRDSNDIAPLATIGMAIGSPLGGDVGERMVSGLLGMAAGYALRILAAAYGNMRSKSILQNLDSAIAKKDQQTYAKIAQNLHQNRLKIVWTPDGKYKIDVASPDEKVANQIGVG